MGKWKVTILDTVSGAVAEAAFFVEAKGLPQTAKEFESKAFEFCPRWYSTKKEYAAVVSCVWTKQAGKRPTARTIGN